MTRQEGYTYLAIDGIEACMQALKDVLNGNLHNCFIELSACEGSCMEGPGMDNRHRTPVRDYIAISQYAGNENLHLPENTVKELQKTFPSLQKRQVILPDSAIEEVLREMGKTRPEDELNCGSCGYNTCREKARAVLEGKATITMCLPYLKEKAESFSNTIIQNTPNAILVVNELLEVQLVNRAACGLLHVSGAHEIMGDQVVRVLDPAPFLDALDKNRNLYNKKVFLAEYGKYIDQTVIYDRNYHIIICIMRDVTEETVQQESRQELNRKTIEVTDKVIEKQMRTVQEIASLLGETTAETKVALTKLKESLHDG